MKPAYIGQCSCFINIDDNNFPEETELDTNSSLTLAQNQPYPLVSMILSISFPVVVTTPRFLILLIWIYHTTWGGIQSLYQKPISDEKSQLHGTDA